MEKTVPLLRKVYNLSKVGFLHEKGTVEVVIYIFYTASLTVQEPKEKENFFSILISVLHGLQYYFDKSRELCPLDVFAMTTDYSKYTCCLI